MALMASLEIAAFEYLRIHTLQNVCILRFYPDILHVGIQVLLQSSRFSPWPLPEQQR